MKEYWESLSIGKKIKLVVTLILCLLVIIFAFQNWEYGELKLVFVNVQIPITLLISISLFIGYTAALLINYKKLNTKEKEIKELKGKIKEYMQDSHDSL